MTKIDTQNVTILCNNPNRLKCIGREEGYTQPVLIGTLQFETKCHYCDHTQNIDLSSGPNSPEHPIYRG